MDNNFKFKRRHVSIVQRSCSVLNSFTYSVELIQAIAYKLKRDTIQNFEKKYIFHWPGLLGQDDWILASFFFGEFMGLDSVSVHKHAETVKLIRHENGAIRKRYSNRINLKTPVFRQ